ncbi:hypothetical protein BC835DRAFT_1542361 [Cytidiella melzeri]|nr:hypothetical protein BC835DRAFT_1542361 [Cytidiella melzeri]
MASHTQHSGSAILELPSELIEYILVLSTALGCHATVAAVAQTCRAMRSLIYEAVDHHLWRELFLAVFDDPRLFPKEEIQYAEAEVILRAEEAAEFSWDVEYRSRVWARNYLQRQCRQRTMGKTSTAQSSIDLDRRSILNTEAILPILRVITTSQPSPPTVIISITPQSSGWERGDDMPPSLSLTSGYPIFPPPPNAYNDTIEGMSSRPLPRTNDLPRPLVLGLSSSANIRWLETIVAEGLPPDLVKKLSGTFLYGGLQGVWDNETQANEFRAFCKLVCCTGFVPISGAETAEPSDDASTSPLPGESTGLDSSVPPTTSSAAQRREDQRFEYCLVGNEVPENEWWEEDDLAMSIEEQCNRARRSARRRVYNLRYLNPVRHWGPYLLPSSLDNSASEQEVERTFLRRITSFLADHVDGHPFHLHQGEDEDEDEDDEYQPEEVDEQGLVSDDMHIVESGEEEDNHQPQPEAPQAAAEPETPFPTPSQLRADWTYLAAVRIVVEANLREAVKPKDMSGLVWLDSLRRSSAPTAVRREDEADPEFLIANTLQKLHSSVFNPVDVKGGHDWAGVTGLWRRCVCWMDYRNLIRENAQKSQKAFYSPTLQEAMRIVPMRLRVESYSPCTVSGYHHRPDIHVLGEAAGPAGSATIRRMKGVVGMIADGSIRWTMYSLIDDEGTVEWVTEGIQVGEAKSAMGVLGMWTGAEHDRADPLGTLPAPGPRVFVNALLLSRSFLDVESWLGSEHRMYELEIYQVYLCCLS